MAEETQPKEEFRRSGFQTLSEGFKVDLPKVKNDEGEKVFSLKAIDWGKVIVRLWFPALTFLLYVLEHDLGAKAAVLLALRTIIDYGWAAGIDARAPGVRTRRQDDSKTEK